MPNLSIHDAKLQARNAFACRAVVPNHGMVGLPRRQRWLEFLRKIAWDATSTVVPVAVDLVVGVFES